jgi:hypothetical protein
MALRDYVLNGVINGVGFDLSKASPDNFLDELLAFPGTRPVGLRFGAGANQSIASMLD